MTEHSNGILGDIDLEIPASLRRDPRPATPTPVFGTIVDNDTGQVELVAQELNEEEQGYVNEDPDADLPSDDVAMTTLDALAPQAGEPQPGPNDVPMTQQSLQDEMAQLLDVPVTPPGNEAFIANAPSQAENQQATGPQISNQPLSQQEMKREFFKDINKFGKQSGEGASALGRLGLRALRAAADGVISTAKPQGGGKDDATLIYEAYTAMDSKHSEHTAGGSKANASKLRQIIGMGCMTTLSDPVAIGDKVVRIHQRMTDAELKPKAMFAALVDVAREQQASDSELTEAAIEACLTKTKADKSLEKEWEAIYKRTEALITGEASHGLKDNSDTALKIVELMSEHIKQYKSDGTRADRIEQMIELGYTEAQAVAIVDKKINV